MAAPGQGDQAQQVVEKFQENIEPITKAIVAIIRGVITLVKDSSAENIGAAFFSMCKALSAYEDKVKINGQDRIIKDFEATSDALLAIQRLCAGQFSELEVIGNRIGCFDDKKVAKVVKTL